MEFWDKLFDKFRGTLKGSEKIEAEIKEEASEVISIDEKVIGIIYQILKLLEVLKQSVDKGVDAKHSGSQRLGWMMISSMRKELNKILETKSVSKEYAEIRIIMGDFVKISNRFKTLPYYDPVFQDSLTDISDKLRGLERLLQLKKSILQEEFDKIKSEL